MKKLKELLSESYAWDKKPGKPLPTLSEVQAEYERKMAEEEAKPDFLDLDKDGDTEEPMRDAAKEIDEAGKFYRGSRHNDEPFDFRDDKPMRPKLSTPAEWDKLMDRVNNDPRFETYTGEDGYQIKDTKGNNLIWQLYPGKFAWKGIGRESVQFPHPRQFSDVAELIKNFYEVTGLVKENVNLTETMRRFGTKNI